MRTFLATLLAVAACLVLPAALVAAWLGTVVDDTDRYVEVVGPLATDTQVVDAVEETLTARTLRTVEENLPLDAGSVDLRPVVAQGVGAIVTSRAFPPAWEAANREAHQQLLAQLRGTDATDNVVIDLGPVATSVADEVEDSLPVSLDLPEVRAPITVLQGARVEQARAAYDVLDAARVVAPAAWLGLVVLALLVARRRGGTLVLLGIGSLLTLGLLLVMTTFARDRLVGEASATDADLTGAVWDGVTASLDLLVYVSAGLAVVLVVVRAVTSFATRRRA